jgi:hypothetical protein
MLVQELSEHTTNVHIQNDALDGMFTFYDATKSTLNVYQVCKKTARFVVFVHTIIGQVNVEILSSLLAESTALKLPHSLYFLNVPGCKCYF